MPTSTAETQGPDAPDCLLLGHHEVAFQDELRSISAMGKDSGAYRDLRLAYVEVDGAPFRAMDLLNHFREKHGVVENRLHNLDFLWPAVAYLVTFLRRRGLSADYVNLPHLEKEALARKLALRPRLVAITTTLHVAPAPILELVRFIRQHAPASTIIVGGPFVYNQARVLSDEALDELYSYLGADIYVVSRTGEGALETVARALKENRKLDGIPNIVFRRPTAESPLLSGEKSVATRLRVLAEQSPERIEEIRRKLSARKSHAATPAKAAAFIQMPQAEEDHGLEENRIDYGLFPPRMIGPFTSLWTSKSCPFACTFCGFPERGGEYRYLKVPDLEPELDRLHALGARNLTFIDDTLNVPKSRFKDMLRLMIRKDYQFRWNCFYRADHGDQETVDLMRAAGCRAVFLGVESGSDKILEVMKKTSRRAHYQKAIPMLRAAGILTHANFIVGFPLETRETVEESMSLIEETRPDTFRAQLWYADPVTPIWREKERFEITGQAFNWKHSTMDCHVAADLVDEMFLRVEGSEWLPQHSFEQWSILYLEYNGMKREDVFAFVRRFNRIIRDRLRNGEHVAPDPECLSSMERLARFERPTQRERAT